MSGPLEYELRESRTGTAHVVAVGGGPSVLILGSPDYDEDRHSRAVCGNVFVDEGEADALSCDMCVQKAREQELLDAETERVTV
jgi:hypothetical protein